MAETQHTRLEPTATTIAYQAHGEGPAIVLVGGATQRKEDWPSCSALWPTWGSVRST